METTPNTSAAAVSREKWIETLMSVVQAEFEPPVRRKHRRYPIVGTVRLLARVEDEPIRRTLSLMEGSVDGLTARSEFELPMDLRADLVVNVAGEPLSLRGRVVHCTQTLGGFKVGFELEFGE